MNFNDVSTHIDLCRSSLECFPENQEQFTCAQKEQIQSQLNRFISWHIGLFSSLLSVGIKREWTQNNYTGSLKWATSSLHLIQGEIH